MGVVLYLIPVAAPGERVRSVQRVLEGWAMPGTRVKVHAIDGGPSDLEYFQDGARAVHWMVGHLPALVQETGATAVCLACFYDLGRREARELLEVPVIGIAEASFRMADFVASRYAVLVGRRKWIPRMQENAAIYGVERRVVAWRSLELTVEDMRSNHGTVIDRILREGRRAVQDDGAEALVLGCAALGENQDQELARQLGVPVINPVKAGFKLAEVLADLNQRWGFATSRVGDYEPKPRP